MATTSKSNRFDKEWQFAKVVWNCLKNDISVPDVPEYQTWNVEETSGKIVGSIKSQPITPQTVIFQGKRYP